MDAFGPFLHLALKSLVVLFPLTVGWLAFRRLALSTSVNAWIYAIMCVFAAVVAGSILPWSLGVADLNWVTLVLALACPALWVATITICDVPEWFRLQSERIWPRVNARALAARLAKLRPEAVAEAPDISSNPYGKTVVSAPQKPIFQNRDAAPVPPDPEEPVLVPDCPVPLYTFPERDFVPAPEVLLDDAMISEWDNDKAVDKPARAPEQKEGATGAESLLALARDLRNNPTSEARRPKLLPPPPGSVRRMLEKVGEI